MKNKNILFFFGILILISSCSSGPKFPSNSSKIDLSVSKEIIKLKEDVVSKTTKLDVNSLLNLSFTDFAFDAKNKKTLLEIYNTSDPSSVRRILLSDHNFLKCCSARGLDTVDIPAYVYPNKNLFPRSPRN